MADKPIVSICCIAYNHEKFIRDAIEGFLMQEVDFPIEIIIHDDASTDSTQDIIAEYAENDNRIIPILREENIKSTGVPVFPIVFEKARGKYLALCEGDDYWTDPLKLQKQVEFMEESDGYVMCFHNVKEYYQNTGKSVIFSELETREYSGEEILQEWIVPTCSVIFRSNDLDKKHLLNKNYIYGDLVIFLSLAEKGKVWGFKDIMGVYRRHLGGMVYGSKDIETKKAFIEHHKEIMKNFDDKYHDIQIKKLCRLYMGLGLSQLKTGSVKSIVSIAKSFLYSPGYFFSNLKYFYKVFLHKRKRRIFRERSQ